MIFDYLILTYIFINILLFMIFQIIVLFIKIYNIEFDDIYRYNINNVSKKELFKKQTVFNKLKKCWNNEYMNIKYSLFILLFWIIYIIYKKLLNWNNKSKDKIYMY